MLLTHSIDHDAGSEIWACSPKLGETPNPRLARGIALRCYRTTTGTRVFLPEWEAEGNTGHDKRRRVGWERFVHIASATGVALTEWNRGTPTPRSRAEAERRAVLRTWFEYASRTKEYLSRHFVTRKDLVYRQAGGKVADVLPESWVVASNNSRGRSIT